jgi:hypothetical protein
VSGGGVAICDFHLFEGLNTLLSHIVSNLYLFSYASIFITSIMEKDGDGIFVYFFYLKLTDFHVSDLQLH